MASPLPMPSSKPLYKSALIKVSGEALMGSRQYGHDPETVERICHDIKQAVDLGIRVAVVTGGGNIYRGMQAAAHGMERASADYMGMLATVMNALALQNTLEQIGVETRVLSAIQMMEVCEPYIRRRAIRHMEQGRVVICAAGTGNPFFTTDTTASLRAVEMGCEVMIKGTQVDGVYDADPRKVADAKHFTNLTYHEMLARDLRIMDASAVSLARENKLPIIVCSIKEPGCFARVLCGEGKFTRIDA